MSVEEWAREQAEKRYPDGWSDDDTRVRLAREGVQYGIVHAFDALLSDEAVEAARLAHMQASKSRGIGSWGEPWRAALQAAVDAVTEGEGDE